MAYSVKEVYVTLQGEGSHTGRPAVFCRFSGCNLWSGREADRPAAICKFCDTDFVGTDGPLGGRYESAEELAAAIDSCWPHGESPHQRKMVVCTGGEPTLQMDERLLEALHARDFYVAIETNGTRQVLAGIDWVCVSPKANAPLVVTSGDELKLVFPQAELSPEQLVDLDFDFFFLQPMDGPRREQNTQKAIEYCLNHPQWELSIQTHKLVGLR